MITIPKRHIANKVDHWQEMIKVIHADAEGVLGDHRNVYKAYIEMINASPDHIKNPFDFHDFVRRQHGTAVAMFIRRQVDTKYISLYRLLSELEKNSELITYTWYEKLCGGSAWASSGFTEFTEDNLALSAKIVKKDRKTLLQLGQKVAAYATEQIAHQSGSETLKVTYDELDYFLDGFEDILKRYLILLTGVGYESIAPIYQYDWMTIFNHRWLELGHSL